MEYEIGKTYRMEITGLSQDGAGVGRLEGLAVFVPKALPGEEVEVELTELKSNYALAKLINLLRPAAARVQPPCSHYHHCGGCQLQHLDYGKQLEQKTQMVWDALTRIGKLKDFVLRPTLGMEDPWHYRNKAQFHAGMLEGKIKLGYYQPGTHQLVPVDNCLLLPEEFARIKTGLEQIFDRWGLTAYNAKTGQGALKHVILKRSRAAGEIMVIIVTAPTAQLKDAKGLGQEILETFPSVVSVVQNINSSHKHNLGQKFIPLARVERIREKLGELEFLISAPAFFQVNPVQTEILYNQVLAYAELQGGEIAFDLYCGIGTISLFLAQKAGFVYGIEEVAGAVADAKINAALNNLTNVDFRAGKVEKLLPKLAKEGIKPELIVLDPPRQGCQKQVLQAAADLKPQKIIYVSCNPSTLARDLHYLAELGYETREVQPVDMFPQTTHVETIARIQRKDF